MATSTHRVNTPSTLNVTSYAAAAFTPAAGELLVVLVVATGTISDALLTDTQNLGWTMVARGLKAASVDTIYMFVANTLAAASSETITFANADDAATGAIIDVIGISGMSRTGIHAVRQWQAQSNGAASGTPAATFATAALTGNVVITVVGNATSPATMTPPTGWTEQSDVTGYSTPTTGLESATRDSGFTGTTVTYGSTSASAFGMLAVEFDTSAATQTAPWVVGIGALVTAASGGFVMALPSGYTAVQNDLWIIETTQVDNVACSATGFTDVDSLNNGTGCRSSLLAKVANTGDGAPTIVHTAGAAILARLIVVRGADVSGGAAAAFDTIASAASAPTTTATLPTITPSPLGTLIIGQISHTVVGNTSGGDLDQIYSGTDPCWSRMFADSSHATADAAALGSAFGGRSLATAISGRTVTITSPSGTIAAVTRMMAIKGLTVGGGGGTSTPVRRLTTREPTMRAEVW